MFSLIIEGELLGVVQVLTTVQSGKCGRVKSLREGDMNDEQRSSGPDQPKAETELSGYQHKAEQLALKIKCCEQCSIQSQIIFPLKT
jgi:hypothetical protein